MRKEAHLDHGEVLAILGVELVVAGLHDGELADVVVDRLLAGRRALQQSGKHISQTFQGCTTIFNSCKTSDNYLFAFCTDCG